MSSEQMTVDVLNDVDDRIKNIYIVGIVQIYPCNLWATWSKVRISRKKGASRGRQEKGTKVTAYVLYCFKWGLLYSGGTVQTMHDQTT